MSTTSYTGRVGELRDAVPTSIDPATGSPADDPAGQERAFLQDLAACYAQTQTGDHAAALASAERALRLAGATPDRGTALLVTAVRLLRAALRLPLRQPGGVVDDLDTALATARREGNAWLLGHGTLHRRVWRALTSDTAGARADLDEAAADALRDRVGLPTRPMTRDLHDAAVDATLQHLGDEGPALRAEATAADPWTLVDQVVSKLTAEPGVRSGR